MQTFCIYPLGISIIYPLGISIEHTHTHSYRHSHKRTSTSIMVRVPTFCGPLSLHEALVYAEIARLWLNGAVCVSSGVPFLAGALCGAARLFFYLVEHWARSPLAGWMAIRVGDTWWYRRCPSRSPCTLRIANAGNSTVRINLAPMHAYKDISHCHLQKVRANSAVRLAIYTQCCEQPYHYSRRKTMLTADLL